MGKRLIKVGLLAVAIVLVASLASFAPARVSVTGEGNLSLESNVAIAANNPPTSEVTERGYTSYSLGDEIAEERTRNSKTFYLSEWGSYTWASAESLHYKYDLRDLEEDWKGIDTTLVLGAAPWDWEMGDAFYHLYILEDFTYGQILKFEKQGESVAFQPMNLEWTNDLGQIQLVNEPQSVACSIRDNTIRWDNAYGSGIDFQWEATRVRLEKTLEIASLNKLPVPEQYIFDGGNPVLRLNLIFDPSSGVDIYIGGELWDKKTKWHTFSVVEFHKGGEVLWGFMPLRYWGSNPEAEDNKGQSVATLEKRGNKLYISIRLPYVWLQNATYPVFIDTDVDEQPVKYPSSVRANRWGGECYIGMDASSLGTGRDFLVGNTVNNIGEEVDYKLYPLEPTTVIAKDKDDNNVEFTQNELGGFEFEVILKKKPQTNQIALDIETQGLKFYYQPELTPEEIDRGCIGPENVVGSYAAYHATRTNMHRGKADAEKYKCGKAFHIYRPKITDADGNWVWGELSLDEQDSTLTITIDKDWLDNAVYPVSIDPNFGYEEEGGSATAYSPGALKWWAGGYSPENNGIALNMSVYCTDWAAPSKIELALYEKTGDGSTGDHCGHTGQGNVPASWGWVPIDCVGSPSILSSKSYLMCWNIDVMAMIAWDDNSVSDYSDSTPFGTFPGTIDGGEFPLTTKQYSVYCTYGAAGVVAPTVTTQAVTNIGTTTATGNGTITDTGGEDASAWGVCWNTTGSPTTADSTAAGSGSGGTGTFTASMTELSKGETYYVKAYATNSAGTGYGGEVDFTTDIEDISNIPTNKDFGNTSDSSTYTTGLDFFSVTNNSNGAVDITIQGTDMASSEGADWLSDWDKRVKLTVDQNDIDAALSNFPTLVYLSTSSGREPDDISFVFDELISDDNRKKIAVTTSDGETQCYVEIEKWDDANEKAWLWVKVPSVASDAGTDLYLYYDVDHANNDTYVGDVGSVAAKNVWDDNFRLVLHFAEVEGHYLDSTQYGNESSLETVTSRTATGKIGNCPQLDGVNDKVEVPDATGLDAWPAGFMIECFVNWIALSDYDYLLAKNSNGASAPWHLGLDNSAPQKFRSKHQVDGAIVANSGLSTGVWYRYVFLKSGGILYQFVDGVQQTNTLASPNAVGHSTGAVQIGNLNSGAGRWSNCYIDEVRISDATRSAAWIKASCESERDHLLDFGNEETYSPSLTWTLSDTATPGSDIYGLKTGLEGGDYTIIVKKNSPYNNLVTGLPDEGTQKWGLKLYTPTTSSEYGTEVTGTVTLTATLD